MITNGDWVLHNYQAKIGSRFKWDVAPLPTGPKGRISETNSLAYGIWSGGKHQDDAWFFTKWLGKEGEIILAKGGAVFPAYLPAVDDFVKALSAFNISAFATERDHAHPVPETPFVSQMNDERNKELPPVWEGKTSVGDAIHTIVSVLDPVLADTPQP